MFPSGLRRAVVGRHRQEPVVELLAHQPPDRRPEPRLVADRVDERHQPVGLLDDPGAVGFPVWVVHPDGAVVVEAVDAVRQVCRQPSLHLVGLHVEKRPRAALAIVRLPRHERADQRRFPVVDVARGADDDVLVVGFEHPTLAYLD